MLGPGIQLLLVPLIRLVLARLQSWTFFSMEGGDLIGPLPKQNCKIEHPLGHTRLCLVSFWCQQIAATISGVETHANIATLQRTCTLMRPG